VIAKRDIDTFPGASTVAMQVMQLKNDRFALSRLVQFFQKSLYGSALGIIFKYFHLDSLDPSNFASLGAFVTNPYSVNPRARYAIVPTPETVETVMKKRLVFIAKIKDIFGKEGERKIPGLTIPDVIFRDKVAEQLHNAILYVAKKNMVDKSASEVYQEYKDRIAGLEDVLDRRPIITEQDFADLKAKLDGKAK